MAAVLPVPNIRRMAALETDHHSPFFWVAAAFIMAAMITYVMTSNLSFWPGKEPQAPVPAVAP